MRLNKIALGVAVGISGAAAVNAADVGLFPFVAIGPTVTTVVTIVDRGGVTTNRYDPNGKPSATGGYLHGSVAYKLRSETSNSAPCDKKGSVYIPTYPGGMITVDLGKHFSDSTDGILFKNATRADDTTDESLGSMIDASAGSASGVLAISNSDDQINEEPGVDTQDFYSERATGAGMGTVYGEAMIFEYGGGAVWGYKTESRDGGLGNDAADFSYTNQATKPWPIVTFMPPAEVTTKLAIVPVDDGAGMFGQDGEVDVANQPKVTVGLRAKVTNDVGGHNVAVAYNRSNEPIKGAVDVEITCTGVITVTDLMTAAAQEELAEGGYGLLSITSALTDYTGAQAKAIVYKDEYQDSLSATHKFNGKDVTGTFNNGFKL